MKKENNNYYNRKKQELVQSIKKNGKKMKPYVYLFMLFHPLLILSLFLPLPLQKNLLDIIIGVCMIGDIISLSGACIYTYKHEKLCDELNNVVTMDYEKKRYEKDKELNNNLTNTKNKNYETEIKNTDERIKLLQEYREELKKHSLKKNNRRINKEMEHYQYKKALLNYMKNNRNN